MDSAPVVRPALLLLALSAFSCGGARPTTPEAAPSPSPPLSAAIEFVDSVPGAGSALPVEECAGGESCVPGLTMAFVLTSLETVAQTHLAVELRDPQSHVCITGFASIPGGTLPAGQPVRVAVTYFEVGGDGCLYPASAAAVPIKDVVARITVGGRATLAERRFATSYLLQGPPLASGPTRPEIAGICWDAVGIPTGHCAETPLAGDPMQYWCDVRDPDGDALTITFEFRASDGCGAADRCWSEADTFPMRLVPDPARLVTRIHEYPLLGGALLTCTATDTHGFSATRSICFGKC